MVMGRMNFSRLPGDVHRAQNSLGPFRWFGRIFVLGSMMPLSGALGLVEFRTEDGGAAPPLTLALFALPFLCIGLGVICWRRECVVDLDHGTLTKTLRALLPLHTQRRKLDAFTRVAFEKRVIQGSKSSSTVYPVMLESDRGSAFDAFHCRNKRHARQTAEWFARLLRCPVADRVEGGEHVRAFEDLDTSLRDRRRRDGGDHDPGPPPSKMRSAMDARDGTITITTPAHGFQPLIVVGMLFATGPLWLTMLFLHVAVGDEELEAPFSVGVWLIGGLPCAAILSVILYNARRRFTVELTNDLLTVHERGLRRRTVTMPAEEIEEVQTVPRDDQSLRFDALLGGGPPITIISDRVEVAIGHTLPREETDYLAEVLRGGLSA